MHALKPKFSVPSQRPNFIKTKVSDSNDIEVQSKLGKNCYRIIQDPAEKPTTFEHKK